MNPWPYILAAVAVSIGLTGGLLILSWRQMVAAEAAAKRT